MIICKMQISQRACTVDEGWVYPFRLEPSADAYLFAWGLARTMFESRGAGPMTALRQAAGISGQPAHVLSVGLLAASYYVEETKGFKAVEDDLIAEYGSVAIPRSMRTT